MLNLSEYKWEEEEIKGDFKIQNLQVLYDRIDESKILNNTDESETEDSAADAYTHAVAWTEWKTLHPHSPSHPASHRANLLKLLYYPA